MMRGGIQNQGKGSASSLLFHEDGAATQDDWSAYQDYSLASKRRFSGRPSILSAVCEDKQVIDTSIPEPVQVVEEPEVDQLEWEQQQLNNSTTAHLTSEEEETIAEESLYTTLENMIEAGDMSPEDADQILAVIKAPYTASGSDNSDNGVTRTAIPRTIFSGGSTRSNISRITMASMLSVMTTSLLSIDPTEDETRSCEEDRLVEHPMPAPSTPDTINEDDEAALSPEFSPRHSATGATSTPKKNQAKSTKNKKSRMKLMLVFIKAFFATMKQKRKEKQKEKVDQKRISRQEKSRHRRKAAYIWGNRSHKTAEMTASRASHESDDDNIRRQWLQKTPKEVWESSRHVSQPQLIMSSSNSLGSSNSSGSSRREQPQSMGTGAWSRMATCDVPQRHGYRQPLRSDFESQRARGFRYLQPDYDGTSQASF